MFVFAKLTKPYNFLQFEFLNFGTEREHLKQLTEKDKELKKVLKLDLNKQGESNIAKLPGNLELKGAIRKWIKKAK
jgi:hypothetical protein